MEFAGPEETLHRCVTIMQLNLSKYEMLLDGNVQLMRFLCCSYHFMKSVHYSLYLLSPRLCFFIILNSDLLFNCDDTLT